MQVEGHPSFGRVGRIDKREEHPFGREVVVCVLVGGYETQFHGTTSTKNKCPDQSDQPSVS
eukprot:765231-Hanusia_phi.AAC.4